MQLKQWGILTKIMEMYLLEFIKQIFSISSGNGLLLYNPHVFFCKTYN